MNNYHLYEEIGHGKFSTVYKGRKRHTIRYVAIKSIEKNRREKVMVEVRVLSQLKHPNIVGFVNWYETRNHLWIIFEYCAGGDLLHLLKQDGRLPEDQVRTFGRDVCAGLLHVHSRGIIYSDLKPANVLFNENGSLKLCDFGHAQRLEDLENLLSENAPLPRRGTPHYMAPELFREGGMHSFASDLWALGCVLHELSAGRPPFNSSSFQKLQHMVLWDPAPLPAGGSADFLGLLGSLLDKSPFERLAWPALRLHGFWQGRPPGDDQDVDVLPPQPHLDELRRMWQRWHGASEQDGLALPEDSRQSPERQLDDSDQVAAAEADGFPELLGLNGRSAHAITPQRQVVEPLATAASASTRPLKQDLPATAALFLASPPPVPAPPFGDDLRGRLGAAAFARVRELFAVAAETAGVRPISRNPQIEEPESLDVPMDMPFAPLRLDEVRSQPHLDLESFLAKAYKCIAQGPLEHKVGALIYLEKICSQQIRGPEGVKMQVADLLVNSSLLRLVLRMLHARRGGGTGVPAAGAGAVAAAAAATQPLRARLFSLIGQLLRHTTYLEPSVADLGLVDALLEGLADPHVELRRQSTAALGELLFYIATQPQPSSMDGNQTGSPGSGGWKVPSDVPDALIRVFLTDGGDEVAQHYAVKTIENIATQCPALAQRWFASPELLRGLGLRASRAASADTFRLSCLGAAAHLLRGADLEPGGPALRVEPDVVALAFGELAPQGVAHGLQLVAALLLRAPDLRAAEEGLPANAVELLTGVLSQPRLSAGIRGRAAVLLALIFALEDVREAVHLHSALESCHFVAHLDRLGREKDRLAVQSIAAAATAMDGVVVALLQSLTEDLRVLSATNAATEAAAIADGLVRSLPALRHMVSSTVLCPCVLGSRSLPLVGIVCDLVARKVPSPSSSPGGQQAAASLAQLQPLVLLFLEALSSQEALILEHAPQMVLVVLPALASFLQSARSDVRLMALKSFSGICILFLNDGHIFDALAAKPSETTFVLETLLCNRVLPTYPGLLSDDPPTPSYAFRLLAALLARGSTSARGAIRDLGLLAPLLAAFRREQALTLPSALLARCLLHGKGAKVRDLRDAGLLNATVDALVDAAEGAGGGCAPPDLAMLDAALGVAEEALLCQSEVAAGSGQAARMEALGDLGPLAGALPALALLSAPLAHAQLASLLDRTVTCCHHLANLALPDSRPRSPGSPPVGPELGLEGTVALLEALAATPHCAGPPEQQDPAALGSLQRRLLAVLGMVASSPGASVEVRAEVAAGMERLLMDYVLSDDPATATSARAVIAAAVGRGMR